MHFLLRGGNEGGQRKADCVQLRDADKRQYSAMTSVHLKLTSDNGKAMKKQGYQLNFNNSQDSIEMADTPSHAE